MDPQWTPRTVECRSSKGGAALTDNQHPEETCTAKAPAGERATADHLASVSVTVIERQTPAHGFEHFFGQTWRLLPIAVAALHSASHSRRKLRAQANRSLERSQNVPGPIAASLSRRRATVAPLGAALTNCSKCRRTRNARSANRSAGTGYQGHQMQMLEWREPFQPRRRCQLRALSWGVSISSGTLNMSGTRR